MTRHHSMLRRVTAVLAVVATGLATHASGVTAAPTGIVQGTTQPVPCLGVVESSGSFAATSATCAAQTTSNMSPLGSGVPSAGVIQASATGATGPGTACSSTSGATIRFNYRDALGTVSFSGFMQYTLTPSLTCQTSYPSGTIAASGTGAYLEVGVLCLFSFNGPSTPPISEGLTTISFTVKTGTTCS